MAVAFSSSEKIELPLSMDSSPSRRVSDAAFESSSGGISSTVDSSDRGTLDIPNSSTSPSRELEIQPPLRGEEHRQLFRLPPEEVLVRDFNCALQENFLLQKIIPFHEVTSVRRANAAAIFPTAIEIMAGGNKYFFTSLMSRDEAFKLISDGWLQHGNGAKAITDQKGSKSEFNSQENGTVVTEKDKSSKDPADELDSAGRNPISEDSKLPPYGEAEVVASESSGAVDNLTEASEAVPNTDSSSSGKTLAGALENSDPPKALAWEQENSDAPKVSEYYTKVAESKFPIKVEEFFGFFFSDDAVDFLDSFHKRCGDKDFRCTSWYPHEIFGHARDVSFQHPIKLYFGARFGSCQEIQKCRVYRNSHLVIETSQEVSDVPYGDYFRVEGLWDVEGDSDESKECCILRVYVNVAFSKKTMWKGKIVQSTVEECRDAYAIWINIADELLKQKNLEKKEAGGPAVELVPNDKVLLERQAKPGNPSERSQEESHSRMTQILPNLKDVNQHVGDPTQGNLNGTTSVACLFRELKSQSHVPLLLVITFALILLLMQLSIVLLLARPQQIQVIPQAHCTSNALGDRGAETVAWLEKRMHHLKDEMHMVETLLEKMRHENALLKAQLKDLENFQK